MGSSKFSLVVLSILFSASSLFAQTDSLGYKNQFQFHLINGYSLSYLNSFSEESALRFRVNVDISTDGSDSDGSYTNQFGANYNRNSNSSDHNGNRQHLDFSAQYIFYPVRQSFFRIFVGIGPFLSLNRVFSKQTFTQATIYQQPYFWDNSDDSLLRRLYYSFNLGVRGVIGVECYINKQISLVGEYDIYGSYGWNKEEFSHRYTYNKNTNDYSSSLTGNNWNAGLGGLRVGVSFNF